MIRLFLFIFIVLVGAVVGLAFLPLATALKMSGVAGNGVEWTEASGSVLSGRLEGLKVKGTSYGDADLELVPTALLAGNLQYAVGWTGSHGQGDAKVTVGSGQTLTLHDYLINLDLLEYERAAKWIRQSGGKVKLEGSTIQFRGSECIEAVGVATSDVLDRNREILGSGWSDLRGDLACEDGQLVVPLASENAAGTRFTALLRVAPGTPGKFEARISGRISRALGFALPLAGFTRDGDGFVYIPTAKAKTAAAAPAPAVPD